MVNKCLAFIGSRVLFFLFLFSQLSLVFQTKQKKFILIKLFQEHFYSARYSIISTQHIGCLEYFKVNKKKCVIKLK